MKSIKYILIILAITIYSCEKTITTIDLDKKDPKLVLHGFIGAEGDIITNLTVSKSTLSFDNVIYIKNGIVEIYDEETQVHSLVHDTSGFFFSKENNLEPSKEYIIKANAPNYPDVSCKFTIPQKVDIISIDTTVKIYTETWEWGETEERKDYTFHVKVNDPQEENFYIARIYRNRLMYIYDEETSVLVDSIYEKQYLYTTSDDISAEFGIHDSWVETKYQDEVSGSRGICFSDNFLSAKIKTFTFNVNQNELSGYEGEPMVYCIVLENISKDYYTFLKSYALYEDTEYDAFAQKVNVYNNVDGGFGIIGAFSQTTDSVTIQF